ncbi:MAG: S-methyl-5-thioribose-1-phosphate isomerase [Betaproteobacteria bacterium]|nr:S-methyl-5-thioribose-1-phosphate isomerase [Betaproteobacteria bacterium]
MKVNGVAQRSIWADPAQGLAWIIDQSRLPHALVTHALTTPDDAAEAIRTMRVRGAPLIGATAAYGIALAMNANPGNASLDATCAQLAATRPTAVNLRWALDRMRACLDILPPALRAEAAWREAADMAEQDVAINHAIGGHGLILIAAMHRRLQRTVNILTHCNAGWLATVDWGTALAPVYRAQEAGVPVQVWVSETRPRNQGLLTAWELREQGIAHTVIADNAAGHLLQRGQVDLVIVGADRVTRRGDVCNKIGTYMKALAAHEAGVPFYAAVPGPTFDWTLEDGIREIPIEERGGEEVRVVQGLGLDGTPCAARLLASAACVANPAFDVTPAHLVTGLITERGVCAANATALAKMYG